MGSRRLVFYGLLFAGIVFYFGIIFNSLSEAFSLNSVNDVPHFIQTSSERSSHHIKPFIRSSREYDHVVFIGDSTLRYSFLEWIDQEYHRREQDVFAAPEMINEKMHGSWMNFFRYTTANFHTGNRSSMTCDCQRAEEWNLGTEIENRYYQSPHCNFSATYLQAYGDNQAHGRYHAHNVGEAKITNPGNLSHPSVVWAAMGAGWDRLILEVVSDLRPRPTAIVMNAGLWSNAKIAKNMGKILQSALNVTGGQRVIWRGVAPNRKQSNTTGPAPSEADQAALAWSRNLLGVIYQPFPLNLNLSPDDYFDKNHFGNPAVYRQWNAHLTRALEQEM